MGTCDYKNNVKCAGNGKGYKGPLPKPHLEPHHEEPHDGYKAPHKPYKHHVSYHEHEQYHHSSPPHDSYGPPPVHHDTYEPPHHDSYGGPHHNSYHPEPPSYQIDTYEDDGGYNAFRGDSSFIDGFGTGFGKENGFGGGFGNQQIRRSGKKSNAPLISTSQLKTPPRRRNRQEQPRNIRFVDTQKNAYKRNPSQTDEDEFGFDELKSFGFGLRV